MLLEDTGTDLTREGLIAGVRAGIPFAVAGGLLALSFGVVAQDAGLSQLAAIVMSAIVFAGSAQFAAIAILSQGGAVGAAIVAAALMNSRFLAMGIALAPSVRGRALWRAVHGPGALGGGLLDDPEKFGLDAIYPAFFGALLIGELRSGRTRGVAAAGAVIALA